jgi:formylglycine-generating enzyme required for sulfatase activity
MMLIHRRGGSWYSSDDYCKVSYQLDYSVSDQDSNVGFRLYGRCF